MSKMTQILDCVTELREIFSIETGLGWGVEQSAYFTSIYMIFQQEILSIQTLRVLHLWPSYLNKF